MIKTKFLKAIVVAGVVMTCALGLAACQGGGAASGGTAATVNGVAISEDEVTDTIQTVRTQSALDTEDAWGQFLASNDMTPESVREQIIDSLVDQELRKQGAEELGVTVDSSEVDTYVESMKSNFDSDEAWAEALSEAGFTEESYRESIESSLLSQAVGKYFEDNAVVTDDDILESAQTYAPYYDGSKRSSHILFKVDDTSDEAAMQDARDRAQQVLSEINSGAIDFADAAKEHSDDSSAENGGDVGWDHLNTFVTAYQEALDALEVDQVSDLVETEYGIHIIKCTDLFTAPEEVTSLDQIPEDFQETLVSMASSVTANNDYTAWVEELRENADIVINDMPANVPYNIDMTKYTSSDEDSEEAEGESGEAEGSSDAAEAGAESSEGSESAESSESVENAESTGGSDAAAEAEGGASSDSAAAADAEASSEAAAGAEG